MERFNQYSEKEGIEVAVKENQDLINEISVKTNSKIE